MAESVQSLVLALIQGVTEFLPVSSSAHLILPSQILGWPDQGLLFDVGVHAGTLCAVLWYFRATLANWFASLVPGRDEEGTELWAVVIATVPVVLAGWLLKDMIANEARGVPVIIATTLIFGILLGFADRRAPDAVAGRSHISARAALLIGSAQVLALIPGTSRSGITITAALFLGYHRAAAARFRSARAASRRSSIAAAVAASIVEEGSSNSGAGAALPRPEASPATPRCTSASARSFSASPEWPLTCSNASFRFRRVPSEQYRSLHVFARSTFLCARNAPDVMFAA